MFASACTVNGMIIPAVIFVPVNRGTTGGRWPGVDPPHRHRLRPGGSGGDRQPPAFRTAHVPADLAVVDDLLEIITAVVFVEARATSRSARWERSLRTGRPDAIPS